MRENRTAMYFEELRATEQGLAFDYLEGKMKEQMGIFCFDERCAADDWIFYS